MTTVIATSTAQLTSYATGGGSQVSSGDTIIIDGTFDATGLSFPDGITMEGAVVGTSELYVSSTDGLQSSSMDTLNFGANTTLRNLKFRTDPAWGDALWTGGVEANGVAIGYAQGNMISIGSSAFIEHCVFFGRAGSLLEVRAGQDFVLSHCYLHGGFYSLDIDAPNVNPQFKYSWFHDGQEGIKTRRGFGLEGIECDGTTKTVYRCVFTRYRRDGIDTTGGFNRAVIEETWFDGMSSIDFKTYWSAASEIPLATARNWDITLRRCFQNYGTDNQGRHAYITLLQQGFTNVLDGSIITPPGDATGAEAATGLPDHAYYAPRAITWEDCIWELSPDYTGGSATLVTCRGGEDLNCLRPVFYNGLTDYSGFEFYQDDADYDDVSSVDGALPASMRSYTFTRTMTDVTSYPSGNFSGLATVNNYDQLADPEAADWSPLGAFASSPAPTAPAVLPTDGQVVLAVRSAGP